MEYTKLTVVQLLLLGSALAQSGFQQQPPFPQSGGFQQGFQPSAFQQQPQRFEQPAAFQPQRQQPTTSGFRSQQQQGEQFTTFGAGTETFKQINNRPAERPAQPAVETRNQFAARPVVPVASPAFQTQQAPVRANPVPAPAAPAFQQQQAVPFRANPGPVPSAAPAPVDLPSLGAPAEQHDAQVFQRRPLVAAPTQNLADVNAQEHSRRVQQSEALRVKQENARLEAETRRIQEENQRIRTENQRIQQENQRFRQESQAQQQQQPAPAQQERFQQAQRQLQEFVNQQDEQPQQEVIRTAAVAQPTRSRGLTRRPIAVVDAAPVRVAPVRAAAAAPLTATAANTQEDELFEEQAKNAQYSFASSVDDKLTDNTQVRQETRDGLNLAGLYSYSDGFFRRTVHYEADENGYRVVKEEVEPIGDGPQLNPNGAAEVQAQISGQNFGYRITADDIKERKETERVPVPQQQRFRQDQGFSQ